MVRGLSTAKAYCPAKKLCQSVLLALQAPLTTLSHQPGGKETHITLLKATSRGLRCMKSLSLSHEAVDHVIIEHSPVWNCKATPADLRKTAVVPAEAAVRTGSGQDRS